MASALDCRPAGWRATLLTDVTNARPQALQYLPGPTLVPFFAAVAILLTALAVLADAYATAGMCALVAVGILGRWASHEPVLPDVEARLLAAELDLPLHGTGSRSIGWWGMVFLLAILFTVLGSLIFSYFYLRLYSDQWPQAGLPLPELRPLVAAVGLLVAAGCAQTFTSWGRRRNHRRAVSLGTAATTIIGLGYLAIRLANLFGTAFLPTANAYASIYFAINGFSLLVVLTGVAMQTGVLVRLLRRGEPLDTPRLKLWLQNSELFWFFAMATAAIGLATTYLVPHVL